MNLSIVSVLILFSVFIGLIVMCCLYKISNDKYIEHRTNFYNEYYGGDWYYNEEHRTFEDSMTDRKKPL